MQSLQAKDPDSFVKLLFKMQEMHLKQTPSKPEAETRSTPAAKVEQSGSSSRRASTPRKVRSPVAKAGTPRKADDATLEERNAKFTKGEQGRIVTDSDVEDAMDL